MYAKPHLSYEQQLELLKRRGLCCDDEAAAMSLLRAVGYYRLSAYVYPFREMLPQAEQGRASPVHFRADDLRTGTDLSHIEALWRFDRGLRMRILDGLETVEVGVRTQVAHVVVRRDPFGHVHRDSLDAKACSAPSRRRDARGRPIGTDTFADWIDRYTKLQHDARNEDFVKHHLCKYGEPLPVWVAVEFLDFGALVRLFGLMDKRDQNEVAGELGIRGGHLLSAWLTSLNYLRNMAAHHNRLWNRTLTYSLRTFNPRQVESDLRHIAETPVRDKVYMPLAVVAYLTRHIDPASRWAIDLREHVAEFPDIPGLAPEPDMGFPAGWRQHRLWMG